MECVVNVPGLWEAEFVCDWGSMVVIVNGPSRLATNLGFRREREGFVL